MVVNLKSQSALGLTLRFIYMLRKCRLCFGFTLAKVFHFVVVCLVTMLLNSQAQVVLDGTLGQGGALSGPDYQIREDLGKRVGSNLFHSFSDFNLSKDESATFSGPDSITNILTRVTGSNPSTIDGLLRSTIPNADFYFMNPNGVFFGPNAKLNVGGSFVVSTADYIGLADGGRFDAINPETSSLTTAAPNAFGFLDNNPIGMIRIEGENSGPTMKPSTLSVKDGKELSLVGGDVLIVNGKLYAPNGGGVTVISVGSGGEVKIGASGNGENHMDVNSFSTLGNISISDGSTVTSDSDGGSIFVSADHILVNGENSHLFTGICAGSSEPCTGQHFPVEMPPDLREVNRISDNRNSSIEITSKTMDVRSGAQIQAWGNGSIFVNVDRLTVAGENANEVQAGIIVNASGDGYEGLIQIRSTDIELKNSGLISLVKQFGLGRAGTMDIVAENRLFITGPTSAADATNTAATIDVAQNPSSFIVPTVPNMPEPRKFSGIYSVSQLNADGGHILVNATNLKIDAPSALDLENKEGRSGITAEVIGQGKGSIVDIWSNEIEILNTGVVEVDRFGGFGLSAGEVTITAESGIVITGLLGAFKAFDGHFTGITSIGNVGGDSGNIRVTTPELILKNRGMIVSAPILGQGNGRSIDLKVDALKMFNGGGVASVSFSSGKGGDINIKADSITLSGVSTEFFFSEFIQGEILLPSTISSFAGPVAKSGGNIFIETKHLDIVDSGRITVQTFGTGNGGSVEIKADTLLISGVNKEFRDIIRERNENLWIAPSSINADAIFVETVRIQNPNERGPGGNLLIEAERIDVSQGAVISSRADLTGQGGDIGIVKSGDLILTDGASISAESSRTGNAGNINLELSGTFSSLNSSITTESRQSDGGDIKLASSNVVLDQSQVIAQARGDGGNIFIDTEVFLRSESKIDASSELGVDGNIEIVSPEADIMGSLIQLPSDFLNAELVLPERCSARLPGDFSSFIVVGSGGIPPQPGKGLAGFSDGDLGTWKK